MRVLLLIALPLFLLFSSCEKKKQSTPKSTVTGTTNPPAGINFFFLKKDGVAFNPSYLEISDPFGYAVAVAAAENPESNANVYSLMINKSIPVGTYDYETLVEEYDCWFSYSAPNFGLYAINSGTFQITHQNTSARILQMKFQFEMEDPETGQTYQVTEGHLKAYY